MTQNQFPPNWDEERVRQTLSYYENQTEDEAVLEDEMSWESSSQTLMQVPVELVPMIRELIARHQT